MQHIEIPIAYSYDGTKREHLQVSSIKVKGNMYYSALGPRPINPDFVNPVHVNKCM